MNKVILAAALLLASTPAQAQQITIDVTRVLPLVEAAPTICRTARQMAGKMGDNIEALMPRGVTVSERLFMQSLCNLYLHGVLDTVRGTI